MRRLLLVLGLLAGCDGGSETNHDSGVTDPDATVCTETGVEGCACAPVATGSGGQITIDRPLLKLVSDPSRCVVYGLASDAVLVFDTRTKMQVARIELTTAATDLDVAGDGSRAVVGHRVAHEITVLDLEHRSVAGTVATATDPTRLEVTRDGIVFYVDFDQWSEVHRVDLASGTDVKLQDLVHYKSDIELADDDVRLYVADSASSSSEFAVYDTTDGVFGLIDTSASSFSGPTRQVLVGTTGHVYYAEHEWADPANPTSVTGATDEPIFAEARDGHVAVGASHVWDAELVHPIAPLPGEVSAAAFAAAGQEVWMYPQAGGSVRFIATGELVGAPRLAPVGTRDAITKVNRDNEVLP